LFASLLLFIVVESLYLSLNDGIDGSMAEKKRSFVSLVGLPDLAISTEATYIRHRSISSVFSIYKDDATLREYFPSAYVFSHSHTINRNKVSYEN